MNNLSFKLKQYRDAIDKSNIVSKTDINGYITFVNDEFCKISGYSRKELIGQPHSIVRHPDVPSENFKLLWDTILAKKVHKSIVKNRAKNGSSFYLNTTIIPILGESGDIEEFVAIRHDVTEVVLLNERLLKTQNELKELNLLLEHKVEEQTKELLDLNKNLEQKVLQEVAKNEEKTKLMFQQSRLANMGEMLANIAHQWRQPLNELSIDLFRLKQVSNPNDEFLDIYEHSKSVIKSMSNTIEDFRNFFNSNTKKEKFEVSSALKDAVLMLQRTLEKDGIKLEINCDQNTWVRGYRNELSQVFVNILTNARDAFKDVEPPTKLIKFSIKNGKNYVNIKICDNAGGIKDDTKDKIFEPYFTTKHPSIGTGLGLYMSKQIIEKLNGKIGVKNIKFGTCFEINIPVITTNKGDENE
ncbi:PAS domain-containing sensor histidine kinase [Campylobacter hyointestinalis]|uniref:PAS domain-containing sensor histidine kinase n=1 Tax=Campylobacter hyointestinalis TaxID=198 RepID=UPI000DCB654C|nr:PAS domain-containing sensor histidine kinase [Campylobacter hyointestinalis]RAZ60836.1 PAS domain-containing sensor histidine kinase [Campylobacter hyointestinalis subsp. lawsonii]